VDLTDDIKAMLAKYGETMMSHGSCSVWSGRARSQAPPPKPSASHSPHAPNIPNRSPPRVGGGWFRRDQAEVRQAFLAEDGALYRDWLAELIPGLPQDDESVAWLLDALKRAPVKKQFDVDSLVGALSQLVAEWPLPLLPSWSSGSMPCWRRHRSLSDGIARFEALQLAGPSRAQSVLRLIEAPGSERAPARVTIDPAQSSRSPRNMTTIFAT